MRKQFLKVSSVVIALTFQVVVWSDAVGLHGCPVHDALPGMMGAMGASDHAMASVDQAQHPGDHSSGESHDGPCTCIGNCQGGVGVSHALAVRATVPLAAPTSVEAPIVAARPELPSPPAFLLPYSQGPPHAA